MVIDIKLEDGGIMPSKEFESAIGYDLFVPKDIVVETGRSVVPLNFRINLPEGYGAYIFNRSGTSAKGMKGRNIFDSDRKQRYDCSVSLGLVDPSFKGVVGMLMDNRDKAFKLKRGDSVAQMVILKSDKMELKEVTWFDMSSERGEQGFKA